MNKLLHKIFLMAVAVMALSSCATKTYQQINYLQDVQKDSSWTMAMNQGIVIQPKDMISIIVSTRNPALSAILIYQLLVIKLVLK
jgi:polysaccharide export outer membrane protein